MFWYIIGGGVMKYARIKHGTITLPQCFSFGKWYLVRNYMVLPNGMGYGFITADNGLEGNITSKNCAWIRGGSWEFVDADELKYEKRYWKNITECPYGTGFCVGGKDCCSCENFITTDRRKHPSGRSGGTRFAHG